MREGDGERDRRKISAARFENCRDSSSNYLHSQLGNLSGNPVIFISYSSSSRCLLLLERELKGSKRLCHSLN